MVSFPGQFSTLLSTRSRLSSASARNLLPIAFETARSGASHCLSAPKEPEYRCRSPGAVKKLPSTSFASTFATHGKTKLHNCIEGGCSSRSMMVTAIAEAVGLLVVVVVAAVVAT